MIRPSEIVIFCESGAGLLPTTWSVRTSEAPEPLLFKRLIHSAASVQSENEFPTLVKKIRWICAPCVTGLHFEKSTAGNSERQSVGQFGSTGGTCDMVLCF